MKIVGHLLIAALFAASAFASDVDGGDPRQDFNAAFKILDNIYAQSSARMGSGGIKIACTILPQEDMVAVAWRIENPDNGVVTVNSGDIKLSGSDGEYEMIDTKEAVDLFYRWTATRFAQNSTRASFMEIHNMPDEDMEESSLYGAAFRYGDASDGVICGLVYYACRLKEAASVTAEITVSGTAYRFDFDGGGP